MDRYCREQGSRQTGGRYNGNGDMLHGGVADHVTQFKHREDPQFGFLTIVAVEAVKETKGLIVREDYWMCNLGTILKGMNTRKDLNTVLKDRSSRN